MWTSIVICIVEKKRCIDSSIIKSSYCNRDIYLSIKLEVNYKQNILNTICHSIINPWRITKIFIMYMYQQSHLRQ